MRRCANEGEDAEHDEFPPPQHFCRGKCRSPFVEGGNKRKELLAKYMAYQIKKSKSSTVHRKRASETTEAEEETTWMTEFQIRRDKGDAVADLLLTSGHMVSRSDRLTGSTKPEHLEYAISTDVVRKIASSGQSFEVACEGESNSVADDVAQN